MPRRLALLTATTFLALAAPALAQPTFTPACASNDACLGLAQPADADSVVVAWRIQTTTAQTVRLRSTQTLESGTATTATSSPHRRRHVERGAERDRAAADRRRR